MQYRNVKRLSVLLMSSIMLCNLFGSEALGAVSTANADLKTSSNGNTTTTTIISTQGSTHTGGGNIVFSGGYEVAGDGTIQLVLNGSNGKTYEGVSATNASKNYAYDNGSLQDAIDSLNLGISGKEAWEAMKQQGYYYDSASNHIKDPSGNNLATLNVYELVANKIENEKTVYPNPIQPTNTPTPKPTNTPKPTKKPTNTSTPSPSPTSTPIPTLEPKNTTNEEKLENAMQLISFIEINKNDSYSISGVQSYYEIPIYVKGEKTTLTMIFDNQDNLLAICVNEKKEDKHYLSPYIIYEFPFELN